MFIFAATSHIYIHIYISIFIYLSIFIFSPYFFDHGHYHYHSMYIFYVQIPAELLTIIWWCVLHTLPCAFLRDGGWRISLSPLPCGCSVRAWRWEVLAPPPSACMVLNRASILSKPPLCCLSCGSAFSRPSDRNVQTDLPVSGGRRGGN